VAAVELRRSTRAGRATIRSMTDLLPPTSVASQVTRDFTVATFVVQRDSVLLLWHRKLQMWLPPGGHIEPNELPDDAAIREVAEEAGIDIILVGDRGVSVGRPRALCQPAGIQLETIGPNHEHIDLIYFARPLDPTRIGAVGNAESEAIGWFDRSKLRAVGVTEEVQAWAVRAIVAVLEDRSTSSRTTASDSPAESPV
jgi:8-oxo-dGTP pyrophosphatase MutT (NUDIX family)